MKKFSLPKDGGLIEAGLPNGVKHTFERIPAHIFEDEDAASERIAEKIAEAINSCDGVYRLGLSTGSSLIGIYRSLVRRYEAGELSFKNVEIYSTDEYYPAPADNHSRNRRLYEELVAKVAEYCAAYDEKASGIDLLVMGMGEKGQVGFNEAGASEHSRTRTVLLPYASRK